MPETYYYATGTEVTSIANAIRKKGGINQQLEFPDDFVDVINSLEPQPNLNEIFVAPTNHVQRFIAGYTLIDALHINDENKSAIYTIDFSGIHEGDTVYVVGSLFTSKSGQTIIPTENISGSFTWSLSGNVYTKGSFTLTFTSTTLTIDWDGLGTVYAPYAGYNNDYSNCPYGDQILGFAIKNNYDGFNAFRVNYPQPPYYNTAYMTATASDIVSGKQACSSEGYIQGTLVIQHYYTGSSTPSSSLGQNGDIYLKT